MKLTLHSKNRIYQTFSDYEVPREWADVMFNYLVHGLPPGSFFTSLLANDAMATIGHSHPSNTILALKHLVTWIRNNLPYNVAYGSHTSVDKWIEMSSSQRREVLEAWGLIYNEQDEIIKILKEEKTVEPFFF